MDIDRVEARQNSSGSDAQPTILPKWLQRISGYRWCYCCIGGIT